jgi:hypothetical protein
MDPDRHGSADRLGNEQRAQDWDPQYTKVV